MSAGFFDASEVGLHVDRADYIVVGSGAGGGAAARVLAKAGFRVAVLEDGPLVPRDKLSTMLRVSMATLFRHQGKMAAFGRATTPILQGRCVGGTTFINSAIVWRTPEKVMARWHAEHGLAEGLPVNELEDAYKTVETEMSERPVAEGSTAGRQDLLMKIGSAAANIESRFVHRYEKGCQGSGRCLHGCPHEAKQSTTVNYLRRAISDGASVHAQACVERIVVEGGRAVAVTGRIGGGGAHAGQLFRVEARRGVVISASVVQSPNLLRRSKIGNPRTVGEFFMAHPGTTVMGIYPDRVNAWVGASQGFEALGLRDKLGVKLETINVPPEVAAARFPGAGPRLAAYIDRLDRITPWSVAVRAEGVGRIRPSLLFGDKVSYSLTDHDVDRVRQGMKALAEMHFRAGAVEIVTGIHGLPEVLTSIDQLDAFDRAPLDPRAYSMVATHLFGGCRAGRDPGSSVVDPNLKVHGVEALHVMDASVFPSNTGVNPQHTVMAIATVAARRLAAG